MRCFRKDDGRAAFDASRLQSGPWAGAGRGVRLRLPYVAGETLSLSSEGARELRLRDNGGEGGGEVRVGLSGECGVSGGGREGAWEEAW